MAIPKKMKKGKELQYETKKTKLGWKKVVGLIVALIAFVLIVMYLISSGTSVGSDNFNVPWWIMIAALGVVLYFIVYFGWKLKNYFVEWILSMIYGFLVMTIILLIGYEIILGGISVPWLKTLCGSLFVGGGGTAIGILVKVCFKPMFRALSRSYLWEA